MPLCSACPATRSSLSHVSVDLLPLIWLQVLTVTGNHILYKAPADANLHPVVTPSAASNATFAANFAARIPVPALNVKV